MAAHTPLRNCLICFTACLLLLPASIASAQSRKGFQKTFQSSGAMVPNKTIGVGAPSKYSTPAPRTGTTTFSRQGNHRPSRPSIYTYKTPSASRYSSSFSRGYSNRNFVGYPNSGLSITFGTRNFGTSGYYRPTVPVYGYASPTLYGSYPIYGYSTIVPSVGVTPVYSDPAFGSTLPTTQNPVLTNAESLAARELLDQNRRELSRPPYYPLVPTAGSARTTQYEAEKAFRSGNYLEASHKAMRAIQLEPENANLKLFASQTEFALGNFNHAADLLNSATLQTDRDQWGFVVKNFRKFYGRNDYVPQTNRLNEHLNRVPTDANAFALRGFHYAHLGHTVAALDDFQRALGIDLNHELTRRLMKAFGFQQNLPTEQIEKPIPQLILDPVPAAPDQSNIIQLVPQMSELEMDAAKSVLTDENK